ncbi:hypothetical protein CL629_00030 [bacterium]|nr:hypothetical protein [bacterium]|tara:strand:- start:2325 stop:3731 length:1407 start_codon:yes stop_codon:yes gene_type:complete
MVSNFFTHLVIIITDLFKKGEVWFILFLVGFAGIAVFLPFNLGEGISIFWNYTWWLWVFLFVWWLFLSTWMFWRQEVFINEDITWIYYEIRIPRTTERGAEAMELVLVSFHGQLNAAADPREEYWDGEVTRWFALEMVSFGGELHFYLRAYRKQRDLTEAGFYAHYPDLELVEIDDYISRFPQNLQEIYAEEKNIWGSEIILEKDPSIPLKTYKHFMNEPAEEKRTDPMGAFLEVFTKIKPTELVGVQILIQPAFDDWADKAKEKIEEFKDETGKRQTIATEDETQTNISIRTPGETEKLKEMEDNIGKHGFNTLIRFVYISPQEGFYDSYPRRGIRAAFNQYSGTRPGRNGFMLNEPMSTRAKLFHFPFIFPRLRVEFRKQRLLHNYFTREIPKETFMGRLLTSHFFNLNFLSKTSILNTEAIASIFHPPTDIVLTTPHIPRQESRRAGPQAGLPVFGEEEDIEKYQ